MSLRGLLGPSTVNSGPKTGPVTATEGVTAGDGIAATQSLQWIHLVEQDEPVTVVRFPAYREYEATRVEASNAMMALLAGAQMASHLLRLTEGSDQLLPEIFPRVPHIRRFNLTTDAAREILLSADEHLGAMSVPYALAIHEDFLKTCIRLLEQAGRCAAGTAESSVLATQHQTIEQATGGTFPAVPMTQLTTVRRMRNCTIHRGGRANGTLINDVAAWSPDVEQAWTRLAGRSPKSLVEGARVTFGQPELILTLAVTKTLAREANELLQPALPRDLWADIVLADLVESTRSLTGAPDALRRLRGHSRYHYGPLKLTDAELVQAFDRI